MSTCNRLDLQTLGAQPIMPKNLPDQGQVPCTGPGPFFKWFEKWVISPTLWKGTSMWGAGLLRFPTV